MNFYYRHVGDYTKWTAHLSLLEHGIYSRLLDVYYIREAPIPDSQAARLIGARTEPETQALQVVLQEFFSLRDGLWHQDRCDEEIAKFDEGEPERETKKANKESRLQRHRDERASLFAALHSIGENAPWNEKIGALRARVAALQVAGKLQRPATQPATATATPATATRHQTPDTNNQEEKEARASTGGGATSAARESGSIDLNGHEPTAAGLVCRAMKAKGLQAVNPGDPRLLTLIAQGATVEEFQGIAAEAVEGHKGFAWVLKVVQSRRAEAADIELAPKPQADPNAWRANFREVQARGIALGIGRWDEAAFGNGGESRQAYTRKVIAAAERQEGTT